MQHLRMCKKEMFLNWLLMNYTLTMNTNVPWLQQHKMEMVHLLTLSQSELLEMVWNEL